jgi:hypothetical protein
MGINRDMMLNYKELMEGRVTKEQYKELETLINNFLKKAKEEDIIKHRRTVKFAKDQFVSFVWSIFWAIPQNGGIEWSEKYDLSDNAIETALKKILKKYKDV